MSVFTVGVHMVADRRQPRDPSLVARHCQWRKKRNVRLWRQQRRYHRVRQTQPRNTIRAVDFRHQK